MLPTVAVAQRTRQDSPTPELLRRLDESLFAPGGWFLIDAENRRVPSVVASTLSQGLDLVGQGKKCAAVVGKLRPGFHVVDVDLPGPAGHAVTEHLAATCHAHGWWHLVRPSGGADGRHHIFLHSEGHLTEVNDMVATLRDTFRAARSKIDLRTTVRPLCSPHRHGEHTVPWGNLRAVYGTLLAVIETMPAPPAPRRSTRTKAKRATISGNAPRGWDYRPETPLIPQRTRRRAALEGKWARYLATGRTPAWKRADDPNADTSPSTYELMCTAALVRAGYTHDEAWAAITAAHPDAMSHARREPQQRWTTHVWNAAVRSGDEFVPTPVLEDDIWAATQQARQRVRSTAWTLPVRQRPSFLLVAATVLRRMETTGSLRVPVPERDLVLDTGLSDRRTIRTCLRLLGREAGTLHRDCFEASDKTSSSYEFSIPAAASGGVSEIPPPSFHTPQRTQLPANLTPLHWLTLSLLTPSTALSAADLCPLLQRVASPTDAPAPHVVRAQRELLADLQALGLAECDAQGRWVRPVELPGVRPARHEDHDELADRVETDRVQWRSGFRSRWQCARQQAVAATRERTGSWWSGLSESERERRTDRLSARFDGLSAQDQLALRRRLRTRDMARGVDPDMRRDAWWAELSEQDQSRRREERLQRWRRLSGPQRVAHVRAWEEYRREVTRSSW